MVLTPTPTIPDTKSHHLVRDMIGGLSLVIIAVLLYFVFPTKKAPVATNTQTAVSQAKKNIPGSFNSFYGHITALGKSDMDVTFDSIESQAEANKKTYHVLVTNETMLGKIQIVNGENTIQPLKFEEFKLQDGVIVAGTGNLAPLTEFKATKVILQKP